jgi:hypothetical protein
MPRYLDPLNDDISSKLTESTPVDLLIEAPIIPSSGGVTGTGSSTLTAATSTASGTTTIVGTSARTLGNDTSTAAGTTTIVGSAATAAGPATSTASGTTTIVGSGSPTLGNDTSTASGTVGGGTITGTGASTLGNDVSTASGTTTVVGTGSPTLGNDTGNGAGNAGTPTPPDDGYSHSTGGRPLPRRRPQPTPRRIVLPEIVGVANITLGADTQIAFGDVDPFNLLAEDEEILLLV